MEILSRERKVKRKKSLALIILPYLLILFLWAIFTYSGMVKPIILPRPHIVFAELVRLLASGEIIDRKSVV